MYDRVRNLYLTDRINDTGLDNAVSRGWITQAEADQIRADKLAQDSEAEILNDLVAKELQQ